jgi:hypothetical protein
LTTSADTFFGEVAVGGNPTVYRQSIGILVDDFDGDGRSDILRWGPTPADNGIYLSNGDGSFRTRIQAGLGIITRPLQATDGSTAFVVADFLGIGSQQILHLKLNPTATGDVVANTNQLYVNAAAGPIDLIQTATTPTGLTSTVVSRLPLTNGQGRYVLERPPGLVASSIVHLQMPMHVITTIDQPTGVGLPNSPSAKLRTEYMYLGLRAERGGRGLLGFREVRQQSPTPITNLQNPSPPGAELMTVATQYLLQHPYIGVASRAETYRGPLSLSGATLLSSTVNIYCDPTSATAPTAAAEAAPCATTAKVARPYLYQSVESGNDPATMPVTALPTVTTRNTFNTWGDPLTISVTTEGVFLGSNRQYFKTTTNTFCAPDTTGCPNKIAGDNWILGRLTRSQVTNGVPNLLSTFVPGAGISSNASATSGPGVPQP